MSSTEEKVVEEKTIKKLKKMGADNAAKIKKLSSDLGIDTTIYDDRQIDLGDGEVYDLKFLVIDKAEKWKPASEFLLDYELVYRGSNQKRVIKLRPLTYEEFASVDYLYPEVDPPKHPETGEPDTKDTKYIRQAADREMYRKIFFLEHALGKPVPGETKEEKIQWLDNRPASEFEKLIQFVEIESAGWIDGQEVSIYDRFLQLPKSQQVLSDDIFSLEDIVPVDFHFRMQRYNEDCILEFPLKSISQGKKKEIDQNYKLLQAPKIPMRDPRSGKVIPNRWTENTNDKHWRQNNKKIAEQRMAAAWQECLPFDIPGDTLPEKYKWISSHIVGEVSRIQDFIVENILGYRSRFDFFTTG